MAIVQIDDCRHSRKHSLSVARIQHMKIMQRDEDGTRRKNVKIASRLEGQDTLVEKEKGRKTMQPQIH